MIRILLAVAVLSCAITTAFTQQRLPPPTAVAPAAKASKTPAPPASPTQAPAPTLSDSALKRISQFQAQDLLLTAQGQKAKEDYANTVNTLVQQQKQNSAAYTAFIKDLCGKGFAVELGRTPSDDASCAPAKKDEPQAAPKK